MPNTFNYCCIDGFNVHFWGLNPASPDWSGNVSCHMMRSDWTNRKTFLPIIWITKAKMQYNYITGYIFIFEMSVYFCVFLSGSRFLLLIHVFIHAINVTPLHAPWRCEFCMQEESRWCEDQIGGCVIYKALSSLRPEMRHVNS